MSYSIDPNFTVVIDTFLHPKPHDTLRLAPPLFPAKARAHQLFLPVDPPPVPPLPVPRQKCKIFSTLMRDRREVRDGAPPDPLNRAVPSLPFAPPPSAPMALLVLNSTTESGHPTRTGCKLCKLPPLPFRPAPLHNHRFSYRFSHQGSRSCVR